MTTDGKHLYVAGPDVVYHYMRDERTGTLTLHDCIDEGTSLGHGDPADCTTHFPGSQLPLQRVNAIALSHDPQQQDLYVAGSSDGSDDRRAQLRRVRRGDRGRHVRDLLWHERRWPRQHE